LELFLSDLNFASFPGNWLRDSSFIGRILMQLVVCCFLTRSDLTSCTFYNLHLSFFHFASPGLRFKGFTYIVHLDHLANFPHLYLGCWEQPSSMGSTSTGNSCHVFRPKKSTKQTHNPHQSTMKILTKSILEKLNVPTHCRHRNCRRNLGSIWVICDWINLSPCFCAGIR